MESNNSNQSFRSSNKRTFGIITLSAFYKASVDGFIFIDGKKLPFENKTFEHDGALYPAGYVLSSVLGDHYLLFDIENDKKLREQIKSALTKI